MPPPAAAAVAFEERDPIWEAILASPIVEDDLSEEERAAIEVGLEDVRAGRVVPRQVVFETIERMRHEQGE